MAAADQHAELPRVHFGRANNLTGAVTRILELFFGADEMVFTVTTTNSLAQQQTRTYSRFSDAAHDVINVRILQGIHFRFGDMAARRQGRRIATWAFRHFLQPVHGGRHGG